VFEGRTYLAPGEARDIAIAYVPNTGGALSLTALATAVTSETVEARAQRQSVVIGPILGLRLVETTPPPYGFSENQRLPLHDGRDITLRYGVLASRRGGGAQDVEVDFFLRPGEVVSVRTPAGAELPCSRPRPQDRGTATCVIDKIARGETVEIDASFRYGTHLFLETTVSAAGMTRVHNYEIGTDIDPFVSVVSVPRTPFTLAEGQSYYAEVDITNRGRDTVEGAMLTLEAIGGDGFVIGDVRGCAEVTVREDEAACELPVFSGGAPATISVLTGAVPEGSEGGEVGLAWQLEVPRHQFPQPSAANETGYVGVEVGPLLADLFVRETTPAAQIEAGVPSIIRLAFGNQGTAVQDLATLSLDLSLTDDAGSASTDGPHLRGVTFLPASVNGEGAALPCLVSDDTATCDLGEIRQRQSGLLEIEFSSEALAVGSYRYEVQISDGVGETGDAQRLLDNSVTGSGPIALTGETVADLTAFRAEPDGMAWAGEARSLNYWVSNDGTTPQDNVVTVLQLDVQANTNQANGIAHLVRAVAVIPSLRDSDALTRSVPCVLAGNTASCALGRLAPDEAAQIFIDWDPFGAIGQYRYSAYVGEGIGEAAQGTLDDNTISGGGEIALSPQAAVISNHPKGTVEYPVGGDTIQGTFSAMGTYSDLPDGHELLFFFHDPDAGTYAVRSIDRDGTGIWSVHGVSHVPSGWTDQQGTVRIGIMTVDQSQAVIGEVALEQLPADASVLSETEFTYSAN
ncbi:MAG: hypothetical protein AAF709_12795, partial [Pseudomonadota bacterium]